MYCSNCGSPLGEKDRFCGNCGARVPLPEPLPKAPVTAPAAEAAAASVPASPLSRPYRLTTLATAVTYGIQAQVASLGICFAAFALFPVGYPAESSPQQDRFQEERIHWIG